MHISTRNLLALALPALLVLAGCGENRVPVEGRVLLDGEPLHFGSVMFQPTGGQPSRAEIQADGSFTLQTPEGELGASRGPNLVRVTCYTTQDPQAKAQAQAANKEMPLGKSLIPMRYTDFATSGIVMDVEPYMAPIELNLSSGPATAKQ